MILSGQTIKSMNIVHPFHERTIRDGLSFGVGPAGYDVTVEFDAEGKCEELLISPGGFALASTEQKFKMPNNVLGVVHDKSTLARKGLAVQNTVLEPGWVGYLTLELTNHSDIHILVRKGNPIAQVIFHVVDGAVLQVYNGKYQNQGRGPMQPIHE